LIKAGSAHEHTSDSGIVHLCEFDNGRFFRSIHFPERIDPNSAQAEYRNGLLHVTAAIEKAATAPKAVIKAA